ncbi:hypothetical protein E4P24_13060 [Haloferax sp. AS1]|nr:hypothetical protein [Haloferax sp. AS1]
MRRPRRPRPLRAGEARRGGCWCRWRPKPTPERRPKPGRRSRPSRWRRANRVVSCGNASTETS